MEIEIIRDAPPIDFSPVNFVEIRQRLENSFVKFNGNEKKQIHVDFLSLDVKRSKKRIKNVKKISNHFDKHLNRVKILWRKTRSIILEWKNPIDFINVVEIFF